MFIFQKLRPFVWMCQCFGAFPFFIETFPETKIFKKFSFSWKHPVTWWFIFIVVIQIIFLITDLFRAWRDYYQESVLNSSLPTIFAIFILLEHLFFFMLVAATRFMIFLKYSHLYRAFCLIQKAENILCKEEDLSLNKASSVNRQVFAGFILAMASAIGFVCGIWAQVSNGVKRYGEIWAFILPISWFFLIVEITLSFLLMYYSYYVVASYIDIIAIYLNLPEYSSCWMIVPKATQDRTVQKYKMVWNDRLKQSKKAFCYLCRALAELNHTFSLPALCFLLLRLISTAYCLYITIYSLLSDNIFLRNLAPQTASFAVIGFINILIVFRAADLPVYKMKNLREAIFAISSNKTFDVDEEIQIVSFVQQLSEDRCRLSAAGLFNVSMHLLPSLTGSVVTYLIILLQSKLV